MKKIFTLALISILICSMSVPTIAKASESDNTIYSDSNISISQESNNSFVMLDKDARIESEIVVDTKKKTADFVSDDGLKSEVVYQQKENKDTITTNIIVDGKKVGTFDVSEENSSTPLLKASSNSTMKLVTSRNVTATMTKVSKASAALVLIGLGLVPGLGWTAAAFSVYGVISEFKNKTAYITIKQYANNYQYRNDLYVYKDSKRTKLLNKQTGIPQRHFS
ncbi:hypothetical protein [Listeria booriae]|uniref:hypothetical protein n=1 Tax=Listeria booriae TaxID=1552123 RepID=UPI00162879C2|nr:hypothetical protein [Listeria booriae]MBC2676554.1 hypothetical protein [Listeria booriae]